MRISTSKVNRRNRTVQLMDSVSVAFDSQLEGELKEESKLEELMIRDSSISVVGKEKVEPKKEEIKDEKVVEVQSFEEVAKDVVEDTVSEEIREIEKEGVEAKLGLEDLKVSELQELCQEASLPEGEWKSLKKIDLIEYVKKFLEK